MNEFNQILLQPTDVLFFRDGRPMGGSLAGHTAAWPLPDVTNHALHAALHRAGLEGTHAHRRGRSGSYHEQRDRKFGSLCTAGPFPVDEDERWYFPRPADAPGAGSVSVTLHPVDHRNGNSEADPWNDSTLPDPLEYAVGNAAAPNKESRRESWMNRAAFAAYLRDRPVADDARFLNDEAIASIEHQIGIGIDPETGSQDGRNIYSAHYLRLREGIRMGLCASAWDKVTDKDQPRRDLLESLLNGHPQKLVVGGQQRICTASRQVLADSLPLPTGLGTEADFVALANGKFAVKWILLSPAIWPAMSGEGLQSHPGGWLPNWISPLTGDVLLKDGDTTRGKSESRSLWRERVRSLNPIAAKLVAAIIPKPIPVTGWALANDTDRTTGGAKSTQLAVPAGAVYHFEAATADAAVALASALNWHGCTEGRAIRNRRSTLLGEKGYGLGVCGTWRFFRDVR